MKRIYYFIYYTIYQLWSKNNNFIFSNRFKADVCIIAVKIWVVISLFAYYSILTGVKIKLSLTNLIGLIPLLLILGSTLYYFTFSNKLMFYFEEFNQLSQKKRIVGSFIVWSIILLIFINMIFSVELMKSVVK